MPALSGENLLSPLLLTFITSFYELDLPLCVENHCKTFWKPIRRCKEQDGWILCSRLLLGTHILSTWIYVSNFPPLLAFMIVLLSLLKYILYLYVAQILVAVYQLEVQCDSEHRIVFTDVSYKCQVCQWATACGWKNTLQPQHCFNCKYSLESPSHSIVSSFYTSITFFPYIFCKPIWTWAIYAAALWVQRHSTGNSKHSHWINYQLLFPQLCLLLVKKED